LKAAHPLDGTPAGQAAHELLNLLLIHFESIHPDTWRALADQHLVPMSNDPKTQGAKYANLLAEADERGGDFTGHDVLLTAWAYCVEAINKYRAGRQVQALRLLLMAERFFGMSVGFEMAKAAGSGRMVASLLDRKQRREAMQAMHDAGKTDAEIGKVTGMTGQRVGQIRKGPKT
jgi:hypothetical protein